MKMKYADKDGRPKCVTNEIDDLVKEKYNF